MDKARMISVKEDDVILNEGEANTEMYKIVSGKALAFIGYGTEHEIALGVIKEEGCFGEQGPLIGAKSPYTVIAYTDMLLLRVSAEEFEDFAERNIRNAIGIMKNMARMVSIFKLGLDLMLTDAAEAVGDESDETEKIADSVKKDIEQTLIDSFQRYQRSNFGRSLFVDMKA